MASLRLFLAISAAMNLELSQRLYIDIAFLYAPIKEDVYIRQPFGFFDEYAKVCHLKRCFHLSEILPPRVQYSLARLAGRPRVEALHV
jgi:hypothetical protein